ncbi:MAG: ABC transporter permease [Anaerolineae bacterium]|nr:ABC transporter permease [Anaerolineae bacterium]
MIKHIWVQSWRGFIFTLLAWASFCLLMNLYVFSLYGYLLSSPDYLHYLQGLPYWLTFFNGQPMHTELALNFLLISALNFILPLVWIILCVRLTLREMTGQNQNQKIELFLVHPVSRWSLFTAKVITIFGQILLMALILWGSLALTVQLNNIPISFLQLAAIIFYQALLVFWITLLILAIGAWLGETDQTALTGVGVLLLCWLLRGMVFTGLLPEAVHRVNPMGLVYLLTNENNPSVLAYTLILTGYLTITFIAGLFLFQFRNFLNNEDLQS